MPDSALRENAAGPTVGWVHRSRCPRRASICPRPRARRGVAYVLAALEPLHRIGLIEHRLDVDAISPTPDGR
jgi:hypothetical protein